MVVRGKGLVMFGRKKNDTVLIDQGRSADKQSLVSRVTPQSGSLQTLSSRDEPAAPTFNADIAKRFHSDIPRAPSSP